MRPFPRDHELPEPRQSAADGQTGADFSKVLVVGNSPVNRVVVSKIVERCGLKPLSGSPEAAARTIGTLRPGIVILDDDGSNNDRLFGALQAARKIVRNAAPRVILLSSRIGAQAGAGASDTVDAVVTKPIIPERLQPVIESLVTQIRG